LQKLGRARMPVGFDNFNKNFDHVIFVTEQSQLEDKLSLLCSNSLLEQIASD